MFRRGFQSKFLCIFLIFILFFNTSINLCRSKEKVNIINNEQNNIKNKQNILDLSLIEMEKEETIQIIQKIISPQEIEKLYNSILELAQFDNFEKNLNQSLQKIINDLSYWEAGKLVVSEKTRNELSQKINKEIEEQERNFRNYIKNLLINKTKLFCDNINYNIHIEIGNRISKSFGDPGYEMFQKQFSKVLKEQGEIKEIVKPELRKPVTIIGAGIIGGSFGLIFSRYIWPKIEKKLIARFSSTIIKGLIPYGGPLSYLISLGSLGYGIYEIIKLPQYTKNEINKKLSEDIKEMTDNFKKNISLEIETIINNTAQDVRGFYTRQIEDFYRTYGNVLVQIYNDVDAQSYLSTFPPNIQIEKIAAVSRTVGVDRYGYSFRQLDGFIMKYGEETVKRTIMIGGKEGLQFLEREPFAKSLIDFYDIDIINIYINDPSKINTLKKFIDKYGDSVPYRGRKIFIDAVKQGVRDEILVGLSVKDWGRISSLNIYPLNERFFELLNKAKKYFIGEQEEMIWEVLVDRGESGLNKLVNITKKTNAVTPQRKSLIYNFVKYINNIEEFFDKEKIDENILSYLEKDLILTEEVMRCGENSFRIYVQHLRKDRESIIYKLKDAEDKCKFFEELEKEENKRLIKKTKEKINSIMNSYPGVKYLIIALLLIVVIGISGPILLLIVIYFRLIIKLFRKYLIKKTKEELVAK